MLIVYILKTMHSSLCSIMQRYLFNSYVFQTRPSTFLWLRVKNWRAAEIVKIEWRINDFWSRKKCLEKGGMKTLCRDRPIWRKQPFRRALWMKSERDLFWPLAITRWVLLLFIPMNQKFSRERKMPSYNPIEYSNSHHLTKHHCRFYFLT